VKMLHYRDYPLLLALTSSCVAVLDLQWPKVTMCANFAMLCAAIFIMSIMALITSPV